MALFGLSACSEFDDARGLGDAPIKSRDDTGAEVVNFPNQFANVAHKCDGHGHRIYVVTHGKSDAPPVVIDDPSCAPGAGTAPTPTTSPTPR